MLQFKGGGNFAYACTRVKAKKRFLLSRDTYARMLVMDLHEIGRFLGETQYREEMSHYAAKYSGANLIEVSVTRNLATTYSDILSYTTGHLREMVSDYLRRWDTFNVKTILRGKVTKARDEEIIETLVPAGAFSEAYLRSLVAMGSLQEIMDSLSRQPALGITPELVREAVESGRLAPLEDHLDMTMYYDLLDVIEETNIPDQLLRQFVRREIDVTNMKVLLKLKAERIPEEVIVRYLIPGGLDYAVDKLRGIAQAEGMSPVLDEIEKSSMFDAVKPALERFKEDKRLSGITIALDKALIGSSEKFAHFYPLSVLPIVNYMIRKKVEVDNIRIIARGKQSGLPTKVIEGLLVV
ncbi:MAG: ATP synthase A1 subunit C [Euryarchaeota archaeon RBG_16_62_10]|nr:MAG: ATP synthase A1 subunit C [Euryarchaeota archaeon RBG_16_62_10]